MERTQIMWDTDTAVAALVLAALIALIAIRGGLKEVVAP